MAEFRFTALSAAGATERGTMEAATEADVVARLQRQGQMPLRVEPAGKDGGLSALLGMEIGRGQALRRSEVAIITRELATMLGAGQDLDRALRFLVDTAPNPRMAAAVGHLRDAVRDGKPLATALGLQPRSFPKLYVGLVRAGEAGGALGTTLEHLAALMERQQALASTVISAMIYPALLLVAAIGSIVLLLTQVLPQFVPLFAQNGASLPGSTQALIDMGDFIGNWGIWVLLGLVGLVLVARQALARPGPGLVADRVILRIPVIGGLIREVLAARFTRVFGTLLVNGVPLIAALTIVSETIGNRAAIRAVEHATTAAKAGAGLSGAIGVANVFPQRTVHLLRLGEETAQLGKLALRAAEIHEERSRLGVQRVVSLLVPAITILMGAAVAGIVSSLLLAMLSINDLAN